MVDGSMTYSDALASTEDTKLNKSVLWRNMTRPLTQDALSP